MQKSICKPYTFSTLSCEINSMVKDVPDEALFFLSFVFTDRFLLGRIGGKEPWEDSICMKDNSSL